jgi:hypothetical protein
MQSIGVYQHFGGGHLPNYMLPVPGGCNFDIYWREYLMTHRERSDCSLSISGQFRLPFHVYRDLSSQVHQDKLQANLPQFKVCIHREFFIYMLFIS